ncbi:hypothetical protein [Marinitoga sp. 1138]|uniref:hypothetical protein n=1 Tax=Marinitoga sp. 1138 TaxID=1643334 RepID=UPI0015869B5C|nr:hypothetical protein [Marinitoga sp. 1138]
MNYSDFKRFYFKHVFHNSLLKENYHNNYVKNLNYTLLFSILDKPQRFSSKFRITSPKLKIMQFLTQKGEIDFGNALEDVINKILEDEGFEKKNRKINDISENTRNKKDLDFHFEKNSKIYFGEIKIRDDHDSTKRRGQIENFFNKYEILKQRNENASKKIIGIIFFIDPSFKKNKNFYERIINEKKEKSIFDKSDEILLKYGKEFFDYLNLSNYWEELLNWIKQLRKEMEEEIQKIDFDSYIDFELFDNISKNEMPSLTKKIKNLLSEDIWESGLAQEISKKGIFWNELKNFLDQKSNESFKHLSEQLEEKIKKYY